LVSVSPSVPERKVAMPTWKRQWSKASVLGAISLLALLMGQPGQRAFAIPLLQLYIEGATYDYSTETWVFEETQANTPVGGNFRLWVVGLTDGAGGKGTISDVRLAASFTSDAGTTIHMTLTPSLVGGTGSYLDPGGSGQMITDHSLPVPPGGPNSSVLTYANGTFVTVNTSLTGGTVTNGGSPVYGTNPKNFAQLPAHGIYGTGTYWQEFSLGDFANQGDRISDIIPHSTTDYTKDPGTGLGQVNAYLVNVSGDYLDQGNHLKIHFDAYDHVAAGNHTKYIFAPFSHTADATMPEPTSLSLLAVGGLGVAVAGWRRRRRVSESCR
jgi:hypothetical protein